MSQLRIKRKSDYNKTRQSLHVHDTYEIFFMLRGERDFFIKDYAYEISEGSVVFVKPKVIHKSIAKTPALVDRYVLMIPRDYISAIALNYEENLFECFAANRPLMKLDQGQYDKIKDLFDRIYDIYEEKKDSDKFILSILVTELMYYLNSFYKASKPAAAEDNQSASKGVVKYLTDYYANPINLDDLADQFFMSSYRLCRVFKKETGFTVIEYLTYVRLREAMNLLDDGKVSVTDVALKVGFNSLNHFIRVFKKHFEITPKQYQLSRNHK